MTIFERVIPAPKPDPPEQRWRIPKLPDASVQKTAEGKLWYYMHLTVSGFCREPGDEPPETEVLGYLEAGLSARLVTVRELLAEVKDSPQVDFPAAVDPVAAMERGELC